MRAKLDVCPLKELEDFTILSCFVELEMVLNFINTEEISSGVELLERCVGPITLYLVSSKSLERGLLDIVLNSIRKPSQFRPITQNSEPIIVL